MNCFEWQCQFSDHLDGTLPDDLGKAAQAHLKKCPSCEEKSHHFRIILTTLSTQPQLQLPEAIRKAPLKATYLPKLQSHPLSLSHLERVPWYIRTLIEGLAIIFFVVIGISYAPQLRTFYEKQIEKSLTDFRENPNPVDTSLDVAVDEDEPTETSTASVLPALPALPVVEEKENPLPAKRIRVGKSELWRFTLKTVSPDELRPQVVSALAALKIPPNTSGIEGIKVPGGIEFDLVLPRSFVVPIKEALEKLAPQPQEPLDVRAGNGNFSWYKIKSKRELPDGMSKVIIWLAQPN